jgi:hypothetical protein
MNPPDWTTLRIFLTAPDLGNVTRAAEKCGITISAAAQRIQDLEADLGVRFLDRNVRGMTLAAPRHGADRRNPLVPDLLPKSDPQPDRAGGMISRDLVLRGE